MSDVGGDPACWLEHVCPACGAMLDEDAEHDCRGAASDSSDDGRAPICPHCGVTALPADLAHVIDTRFVCENPDCEAFGEVC